MMYFQVSSRFFINLFAAWFFAYSINTLVNATDLQDSDCPKTFAVKRSLPINIFDEALAVTKSRLSFYKVRQNLLDGNDEVSLAYQEEISAENNIHITSGMGDYIMQMISSPEKFKDLALTSNKKGNTEFLNQWKFVKNTILKLKQKWDWSVFQEFQSMSVFFVMREQAGQEREDGFTVHDDVRYIASDVKDFDIIQDLLKQSDPYVKQQQVLKAAEEKEKAKKQRQEFTREQLRKAAEEKAKEEKQRKEFATKLWATKSPEEIAAWIDGDDKKTTNKNKRRQYIRKKMSDLSPKSESVEKKVATVASEPAVDTINLMANSPVIQERNKSPKDEKTELLQNAVVKPDIKTVHNDLTPKEKAPEVIFTPKLTKQQNHITNSNAKVEDQKIITNENSLLTLKLGEKHISTLKSVLQASSHPPVWGKAVKAVCEIIKQWGGSYREDLGKGSAAEFWVGNTRFIVDKTHSNGLMYRAQMKFMAKGLQRAGVTLELLNNL